MSSPDIVLRGKLDAGRLRRYTHLPFAVPAGVKSLHVAYEYSQPLSRDPRLSGSNTLDIGLFDPRGIGPQSPGYRGWSGSSRWEFTVSETWATPPYLPGAIAPGTWHVLLGLYNAALGDCEYEVRITFSSGVEAEPPPPHAPSRVNVIPPRLPPAAESGWIRGDLHCHTLYSDGDSWPAEMLAEAVSRGLEFLGVTDHNITTHQSEYAGIEGDHLPLVLPGIEVTTYGGHWNAWGTNTWWDFRDATEAATSATMQAAAASGAVVSVNHPKPRGPAWEYAGAVGFHAVEVWNGLWQSGCDASLNWWEERLRAGRRIVALGGSDMHNLNPAADDAYRMWQLGHPTTWAFVGDDRSPQAVLNALRGGRVFISRDPEGPQLYFSFDRGVAQVRVVHAPSDSSLLLVSANGAEVAAPVHGSDWSDRFQVSQPPVYLRAQLVDRNGEMLALSNPAFGDP